MRPLQENELFVNLTTLGGTIGKIIVHGASTLGDLQPTLVNFVGGSFPAFSASLASNTTAYTEFHDKPFELAKDDDTFTVTIACTTDPSLYAADARAARERRRCGWPMANFEVGVIES
jgi:hypothetical protein